MWVIFSILSQSIKIVVWQECPSKIIGGIVVFFLEVIGRTGTMKKDCINHGISSLIFISNPHFKPICICSCMFENQ